MRVSFKKKGASQPAATDGEESPITTASMPAVLSGSDVRQLWFALIKKPWSSLVLVPGDPRGSALQLSLALAKVGELHRGSAIRVINAERQELGAAPRLISEMTSRVVAGEAVIVAVDSVVKNQVGIPLALAADAVLLCITLGQDDLPSAQRTLELVGKDRFIGAVTLPKQDL